ncbi:ABC transporter ATP-binding protein [Paenibacillus sp. NFR01]|uniref:ABC transporter ATP-binding protein n=1 Tax=Paenibacillus sp. NFR01 TaxID=1566279 RepID=UPI0008D07FBB|nr:ABC transporter ATP-binding protein [Paenibacillus sp. NFR01]SEU12638.1 putative ABC transport system ATP-binding protein [Paenibacillus sp. NFR01]
MTTATADIIQVIGVTRTFGKGNGAVTVLKGATLALPAGKFIAFRGRSGSGKTTLINLLGALDQPTEGSIRFDGREITNLPEWKRDEIRRQEIGLIFQSFALVPLMTALENVEFMLRIADYPAKLRRDAALFALEQVGLGTCLHHRPFEMSGGEQQRTAIARAIAHKPKLILADEPTAELDSRTGLTIIKIFRDLVQQGMSVVLTTHDPAIMDMVDQVYELEDGHIVAAR